MSQRASEPVVRRFYRAFLERDFDALRDIIAEDAEWHASGRSAFAGSHTGREAVLALLRRFWKLSGGTLRPWGLESHDVCASDYHLVLMDRWLAEREGKQFDGHVGFVLHAERGKITVFLPYFYDQYTFDDFWS